MEKFKELAKRPHIIPPSPIESLVTTKLTTINVQNCLSECSNTKSLLDCAVKILNYEDRRRKLDQQLNNLTEERKIKDGIKNLAKTAKRQKMSIENYIQGAGTSQSSSLPTQPIQSIQPIQSAQIDPITGEVDDL